MPGRIAALGLMVTVSFVAGGCGGRSATVLVRAAVERSDQTYFAFTDSRWWGRSVEVQITSTKVVGDFAGVVVEVHAGSRLVGREATLLQRSPHWHVIPALYPAGDARECRIATAPIERLFSCDFPPDVTPGYIFGPTNTRAPKAQEREELAVVEKRYLGLSNTRCVRFLITVSSIDDRYASVRESFHAPFNAGCLPSNGQSLYFHQGAGQWQYVEGGSDALPCLGAPSDFPRAPPAGVLRSVFGGCVDTPPSS